MTGTETMHATAIVLGDRGIALIGESGSGKSALGLELVRRGHARQAGARLVADDRILAVERGGRLVVRAPAAIAGLVEIRGYGPVEADREPAAIIDLLVVLAAPEAAPRHREDITQSICGVELPCLVLPGGDIRACADAIEAWACQARRRY